MKNINTISMYGEKFYQLHAAQRQLLRPLNLECQGYSDFKEFLSISKIKFVKPLSEMLL